MLRTSNKPAKDSTANLGYEAKHWLAADKLRHNMGAAEYKYVVLSLVFLKYISETFEEHRAKLLTGKGDYTGTNPENPNEYKAEKVFCVPADAPWSPSRARGANAKQPTIGTTMDDAMVPIERGNPQLAGVLPKTHNLLTSTLLKKLLKKVPEIPASLDYGTFGRIYEYFLGEFAMSEGLGGGEFCTPSSIVRLLTKVIEPYHGRILDPACGSGGMFVSSARFVSEHKKNPAAQLSIHGVEKTDETGRLCRLNLADHGLEGEIKHDGNINSYYDDPHDATGRFDFLLANPPFNVNAVDKERLKDMVSPGRRLPIGQPRTDNATASRASAKPKLAKPDRRSISEIELHYIWTQLFHSALNEKDRAGLVMANNTRIVNSFPVQTTANNRKSPHRARHRRGRGVEKWNGKAVEGIGGMRF